MERIVIRIPEGKYENPDAVDKVISYILRLDNINLAGGYGIVLANKREIIEHFHKVKIYYGKTDGKQIRHFIFSVNKKLYFKPEHVKQLGYLIGRYFENDYQVVFAVHDDSQNLHIHMGVNTVAYTNGVYRAYWDIEELKAYAEKCMDLLINQVWFAGKSM